MKERQKKLQKFKVLLNFPLPCFPNMNFTFQEYVQQLNIAIEWGVTDIIDFNTREDDTWSLVLL